MPSAFDVDLIGGDTTRGPLNICVQILGEVPAGQALLRSGARPGDEVWVSGTVGDAALALAHLRGELQLQPQELDYVRARLDRPTPRVGLGNALRGRASSAIDISDGLVADAGHLAERSGVRLVIDWPAVPLSPVAQRYRDHPSCSAAPCAGGDDYELCFTAASSGHAEIVELAARLGLAPHPCRPRGVGVGVRGRRCGGAGDLRCAEPGLITSFRMVARPNLRFALSHPAHFVALGFGSGLAPVRPGDVRDAAGVARLLVAGAAAAADSICSSCWAGCTLPACGSATRPAATWAWRTTRRSSGTRSPRSSSCSSSRPTALLWQALAFLLFRLFDIFKPGPIRYVERMFRGGFGVMVDDLVAAFFALICLALMQLLLPSLGGWIGPGAL